MIPDSRYSPREWMRAILWLLGHILLYVGVTVGTIYVVGRLRTVIMTIFVATILAYIMRPMATWLSRNNGFREYHAKLFRGLKWCWWAVKAPVRAALRKTNPKPDMSSVNRHACRGFATIYVLIFLFVGSWYTVKIMTNPFVQEVKNVTDHWGEYQDKFDGYKKQVNTFYLAKVKPEWRNWIEKQVKQPSNMSDMQRPIATWMGETVGHLFELAKNIVEVVLLPVLAFYFALDSKKLKHEFVGTLPAKWRRETFRVITEFNRIMDSFVVGQVILCLIAGFLVGIVLWGLGVKYPLMLALMAGVTRAIPIIGPIIGGIPIVLLTLVTQGPATALGVLAFFTFLHFAESKFLMPTVIGERMDLHPVVIIVVLLIGQEFGGLLGMFFAAPVAALLRFIVRRYLLKTHLKTRALKAEA